MKFIKVMGFTPMLDRMRSVGYVRHSFDDEEEEFGPGWYAVYQNDDDGPFPTQVDADEHLQRLRTYAKTKLKVIK